MQGNPENFQEENDLLNIDDVSGYTLPEQKSIVLDLANNKILDTKEFSPIQMIYLTAKEKNIPIKQFEVNANGMIDSGCRKSGCYGRGYKGFAGTIPIPCDCLFESKNIQSDGTVVNRKIIRHYEKVMSKEKSKIKNDKIKELGLKPLGNDLYGKFKKGTKELLKYRWKERNGKWNFSRVYEVENLPADFDPDNYDKDPKEMINDEMDRNLKAKEYKAELDAYSRPIMPWEGFEEGDTYKHV